MMFKAFESGIFSKLKESKSSNVLNNTDSTDNTLSNPIKKGTGLKVLAPKKML